jgi:hypothetical protein
MNKKVVNGLLTIALALALSGSAFPQNVGLSATIPFDFYVGAERMNSGNYTVQKLTESVLVISSADNQHRVAVLSNAAFRPLNAKGSTITFNHYADGYFLSQVSWEGGAARSLPPTRVEIEAAKNIRAPKAIEISAK